MLFKKIGRILKPEKIADWWQSHAMAPSAVLLNENTIRVFLGCWDKDGISRIGFIDVDAKNPLDIKHISRKPVLDIGEPGMFDENGVFPAHAYKNGERIYLYYTGFQLGFKIRHYNFGGLAVAENNSENFMRVSKAPILDRKDEGLFVRAGQSILIEDGVFKTVYSAGSGWAKVGGKLRPVYDVFYQESDDGISYENNGTKIVEHNEKFEHGLGRPQIVKIKSRYYVFYTRRTLDMKYFFGFAVSEDGKEWRRADDEIEGISHSEKGWDSEMIYFPSVVQSDEKVFMFYSGNDFGGEGFGVAEILV